MVLIQKDRATGTVASNYRAIYCLFAIDVEATHWDLHWILAEAVWTLNFAG